MDLLNILYQANIAYRDKNSQLLDKLRKRAQKLLEGKYFYLQKRGILQYHFVFPDNRVFLRMHKTGKYGDDLTGIRTDFDYVNRNLKIIRGLLREGQPMLLEMYTH